MQFPFRTLILATLIACCLFTEPCSSQDAIGEPTPADLKALLDQQATELQTLRERLDAHESIYQGTASPSIACDSGPTIQRVPALVEDVSKSTCDEPEGVSKFFQLDYISDYDRGFLAVRPVNPDKHPFELMMTGWIQFRHHAFSSDVDNWTDNAGVTRDVKDRNVFDIERARLAFSGFAQDPRLTYFLQLDGDTDGGHTVDFFDYWWAWAFSDSFQVQVGKRKVAASRQWLLGARRTRFIDRPMANDFFRPDRTVGIFGVGKVGKAIHYEVMLGNGYNTSNLPEPATDTKFTFAVDSYLDPLGDYGGNLVDFDGSDELLLRFGHSFVYSPQAANTLGQPFDEADFIRLSDGTQLTQIGALAPWVTVSDFDVYFYGIDAAAKWRGWSINSEIYFRWINEIQGNAPLPINDLSQNGFYVEGGHFLVPKTVDANLRYSHVNGDFGDASEIAAGINWYPLKKQTFKLSFDIASLDGSPLQNRTSDILVGDNGILYRTQFQAEF